MNHPWIPVAVIYLIHGSIALASEITVIAGKSALTVEIAATEDDRALGLMHRPSLPEGRGMLFIFPESDFHAMWMKNTRVPLSVAFLDENGVILNIADMDPHSEVLHAAVRPAKFALEANRGWFAKRGIKPGMRVSTPAKLPEGR